MNWQMVLLFNITIVAISIVLAKLITDRLPNKAHGVFIQYLCCAIMASGYWLLTSQDKILIPECFGALGLGFFVCFGAYCQWHAHALNLSKTALLDPLSEVITIILVTVFLFEFKSWNLMLVFGIIYSFKAVYIFKSQKEKGMKKEKENRKWLFFTLAMVTIFGIATFGMKVFASKFSMPKAQFLMFWYTGAFLGSLILLYVKKQNPLIYPGKFVFLIPLLSLGIVGNLATLYWALQLTEASRVIPVRLVGEIFVAVLIGLFIFKERKELSEAGKLGFWIGTAGALFIFLS